MSDDVEQQQNNSPTATDDNTDNTDHKNRLLLLEEAEEGLAQSLLIFLYADLRLLSATGRIHTKFETLCIDSDLEPKTTAASLASTETQPRVFSLNQKERNEEFYQGMSPAQIMAALILEIRHEIQDHKETLGQTEEAVGLKEDFIFLRDARGDKLKLFEENMHSLLQAYNDMIKKDRNKEFKGVSPRNNSNNMVNQTIEIPNSIDEDEVFEEEDTHLQSPLQQEHDNDDESENDSLSNHRPGMAAGNSEDNVLWTSARRVLVEKRKSYVERRRQRQEALRALVHKQSMLLLQGEEAVAHEEFEELGNTLFADDTSAQTLSPDQVVALMEKAVESRVYGELSFLADFFKPGTVSYVMAKSKARVVWLNDWYPIKDVIYALSVDTEKKRVLVVFRGAITQADWHHAYDRKQIKIENPVLDNYKGRKDYLRVHSGFYRYLFRRRKDTGGTTKYDEIANMVHAYGMRKIGPHYTVAMTGFSLGAALATFFGLYASTEARFVNNGPVKLISFGSPMVGGPAFADAFRHQEQQGKLQYARFYNVRDVISHLPFNILPGKRGARYLHVGLAIKVPRKYTLFSQFQTFLPEIYHVPKEGVIKSYWRAVRHSFLLNSAWPWKISKVHSLNRHQVRLNRARLATDRDKHHLVNKTLDELYEELVLTPAQARQQKRTNENGTSTSED